MSTCTVDFKRSCKRETLCTVGQVKLTTKKEAHEIREKCEGVWEKKDCDNIDGGEEYGHLIDHNLYECVDKLQHNDSDRKHWCKQHMVNNDWNACKGWQSCTEQGGTLHSAQWYPESKGGCPDGVDGKKYTGGCGSYTYCSKD
tara:strand:+ start:1356 stop:1784 length:429 start_codon:yes stop_codon:yes gene_type:complete